VTLVRTRGLNENLGFENWKKKIKGEGGGSSNCGSGVKEETMPRKRRQNQSI